MTLTKLDRNTANRPIFSNFVTLALTLFLLTSCGGTSSDNQQNISVIETPDLNPVSITGIMDDEGHFDPAPTRDGNGDLWMSYSHVSTGLSNISHIETRLATSADAGLSWLDAGVSVNPVTSLTLPSPNDINAIAHEVSRLIYNPFAVANGADPWQLLWHRYLSVLNGNDTVRLFEHGWIGLKSGATALTLGTERKLFTGHGYDSINNSDSLGSPEYPLETLFNTSLADCVAFTEPGILAKINGLYISLLCARSTPPGKIILLRCEHDMSNCNYQGDLITGDEASSIDTAYDGFSASEMVEVNGQDYLMVTPTLSTGNLYRGCVVYKITDLDSASIERKNGQAVASLVLQKHGDFNGACGYTEGLTGSGIMMSEAFFTGSPTFRLFTTGIDL